MPSVRGKPTSSCAAQSRANPMSTSGSWSSNGVRITRDKYLTKNNFIFFSEVLEHVFHVVNQMRPAFIRIELYPFVFDKAPQYFYTIQFWRIFWKIKDV